MPKCDACHKKVSRYSHGVLVRVIENPFTPKKHESNLWTCRDCAEPILRATKHAAPAAAPGASTDSPASEAPKSRWVYACQCGEDFGEDFAKMTQHASRCTKPEDPFD